MIFRFLRSVLGPQISRRAHTMQFYKCYLDCVDNTHDPIRLPHGCTVIYGRDKHTKIKDTRVSRKQVKFTANCIKKHVSITYKDSASGSTLKDGETMHFLPPDKYRHRVRFEVHLEGNSSDKESSAEPVMEPVTSQILDAAQSRISGMAKKRNRELDSDEHQTTIKKLKGEPRIEPDISNNDDDSDDERERLVQARLESAQKALAHKVPKKTAVAPSDGIADDVAERQGDPLSGSSWLHPAPTLTVYKHQGLKASSKIAAFDIDGTIICTQSGKVFATHAGDWRFLYPDVPGGLKKLFKDNYKIVFFTNQMGIEKGKVKMDDFKHKVENIISKLGIPVHVLIANGAGRYRKPCLGMWDYLLDVDNDGIKVDMSKSMYVGDAAGRPKDWLPGKKKDFSCSDRLFALNANLTFHTPEEWFLKQSKATFNMPKFDPRSLDPKRELLTPPSARIDRQLKSGDPEMIVMVGSPASGKSHFVEENFLPIGHVIASRDKLKTWQKCVDLCDKTLSRGRSVIVDNTNPDPESRKRYIDVAKKYKASCRCFCMSTTLEQCKHNERFRQMTDTKHEKIGEVIMHSFGKNYREPSVSEGFSEVVYVNFVPQFKNKDEKRLYSQFLIDK